MLNDKKFVFIVGSPRSGTTWLQALLSQHPRICTLSELKLFDFYTASWIKAWQDQTNIQKRGNLTGLPLIWNEEAFYGFLREFLYSIYEIVAETNPAADIIIDKTPAYALYVNDIERLMPNSKFIHVVRDGRDVCLSLRAASSGWGTGWAPDNVQSGAKLWKKCVLGARDAEKFHGRYLEVKYEQLLGNGAPHLLSVFKFIGLHADLKECEAIISDNTIDKMRKKQAEGKTLYRAESFFRKGTAGQWHEAMTTPECYLFDKIAGDLLRDMGYATADWWMKHWHERFSAPLKIGFSRKKQQLRNAGHAFKLLLGFA